MRTFRSVIGRFLTVGSVIAIAGTLLAGPAAGAKPARCHVVNASQGGSYGTLQAAVDAASPGATLRVRGTCVGGTSIAKDLTIVGRSSPGTGAATLDGDGAGRVLKVDGVSVTVIGIRITNGVDSLGGGIWLRGALTGPQQTLTLVESTVTGNVSTDVGGGIALTDASLVLDRSLISGNDAASGGGIWGTMAWDIELTDSTVAGNRATGSAGGIYHDHGGLVLWGTSSIHDNVSGGYGGGVLSGTAWIHLHDSSSVHDNAAALDGGGLASGDGATRLFDDSSVHDNVAGRNGGGISQGFDVVACGTTSSVYGNRAVSGVGGGIYAPAALLATVSGCVDGGNVHDNVPDQIYVGPLP